MRRLVTVVVVNTFRDALLDWRSTSSSRQYAQQVGGERRGGLGTVVRPQSEQLSNEPPPTLVIDVPFSSSRHSSSSQ